MLDDRYLRPAHRRGRSDAWNASGITSGLRDSGEAVARRSGGAFNLIDLQAWQTMDKTVSPPQWPNDIFEALKRANIR
ncbi:MAG: hypothetical protein M0Z28_11390, partial [Rhodospirillales bacterium]|nr:hypothetical protein [Rhodospirillales bacterium]